MNYFIAGSSALRLIRLIRKDACDLSLSLTDVCNVSQLPHQYLTLRTLGLPELCSLLEVSESQKLHLLSPDKSGRRRSSKIKVTLRSTPRGENPFLEVVSKYPGRRSELLPKDGRLFVESPSSIVLTMAHKLAVKERRGELTHQQSALMLLKLCLELCGTFTLDPLAPNQGKATFFLVPVLRKNELITCAGSVRKIVGLPLMREVIPFVFEKSASPGESFAGCALFGPTEYGGLLLGEYETNKELPLSPLQRKMLSFEKLTPDFYMAKYRIAFEYNGEGHEAEENTVRDRVRMNGYSMLSCKAFVITRFEVRDLSRFNQLARQVVGAIENYEGPKARHRFERLMDDKEFLARQRTLFSVFKAQFDL